MSLASLNKTGQIADSLCPKTVKPKFFILVRNSLTFALNLESLSGSFYKISKALADPAIV